MDSEYVKTAKRQIKEWETRGPGYFAQVSDLLVLPFERVAAALVPAAARNAVASAIHKVLAGLSSATHVISNEEKIRMQVELACEEYGDELKGPDAVAEHYWKRGVAYGLGEGAATGAVGLVGLAADVPALLTVSLRLIRQIGICYGYDAGSREEREYIMHVLRVGSSSDIKSKLEFLVAVRQLEQTLLKVSWQKMGEALARKEISRLSILAAMRQFAQRLGVQLTKRKALQMVPLTGALIGASFNGVFVNDVGRAAYMLYRGRRIAELEGPGH